MNLRWKLGLASGLDRLGLLSAFLRMQATKCGLVLTFHRVLRDQDLGDCYDPHLVLSATAFEQLLLLLRREFQVVSLEDLVEHSGSADGKQRVALTFDDGWEDTHSVAYPMMLRYGMPATVFLCTALMDDPHARLPEERFAAVWAQCKRMEKLPSLVGDLRKWGVPNSMHLERSKWSQNLKRLPLKSKLLLLEHLEQAYQVPESTGRRLITWEEAQQMARNNITFGSHTAQHCTLSSEQDTTIIDELVDSREAIEKYLGTEARFLAYPNGAFNERVVQLAGDAGYTHAFTTERGVTSKRSHHFRMPRISMDDLVVTDSSAALHPPRVRFHLLQGIPR